jgi:hypothetical protein
LLVEQSGALAKDAWSLETDSLHALLNRSFQHCNLGCSLWVRILDIERFHVVEDGLPILSVVPLERFPRWIDQIRATRNMEHPGDGLACLDAMCKTIDKGFGAFCVKACTRIDDDVVLSCDLLNELRVVQTRPVYDVDALTIYTTQQLALMLTSNQEVDSQRLKASFGAGQQL